MIGIIAGANFSPAGLEEDESRRKVETAYGEPSDLICLRFSGGQGDRLSLPPRPAENSSPPHQPPSQHLCPSKPSAFPR